ncbi:DEAD/DEAH box helicase [Coraliomargarita akajimensis]|nr:DEAD/DEAH box helicase [Coraliomargarita akajimensis]
MDFPLQPLRDVTDPDVLLEHFLDYALNKGIELYPAQEEAMLELFAGKHVILNTPTGSGKSLVAAALHFLSASTGRQSVYTCPIKALVNEKFLALCKDFGPENVGMMTGDASVNRGAPILCCTAEILANIALRDGPKAKVHDVIMDEFHYYSDQERGVAWQAPLLTLPQARFLLISATLGETHFFERELERVTGQEAVTISSTERPVPLDFSYVEDPLTETLQKLQSKNRFPVYIVHFTQRSASETAQSLLSLNVCSKEEKAEITKALEAVPFTSPFGKEIKKLLRNGIGLHHAGLLPKYRVLIEKLAQQGLLKIICGTDTLGVGVNVPIRTVLFTQLCKYGGSKTSILTARDFHQISGRAGRKGFDDHGYVVAMAPEHVIENKRLEAKAAADPKKKKKLVKRKPPERGYVHWDEATYTKLQSAPAEALKSSFKVSHSMLLNVLSREGDGCAAMRSLINDCHNNAQSKQGMRKQAFQLFRALVDRNIIEILPKGAEQKLRVNVDLQDDFSLNQALSLYCIDALGLLNTQEPDYALKLLSLVESILENPDIILRKQLDKVKSDAFAEMKAAGVEYEERMEKLDALEYPKPESDFIYETYNQFAKDHPWVGGETIKPKSIAREMFERYCSFADYVKTYGLMRAEGLLLRHLTNVYRVLVNTVPPDFKTEPVDELITYIEQLLRVTDSSLLDEWESLKDPDYVPATEEELAVVNAPADITRDRVAFTRLVRNEVFAFVRELANKAYKEIEERYELKELFPEARFAHVALEQRMAEYYDGHEWIRLDPPARAKEHTRIQESEDRREWIIEQTLVDPEGLNDVQLVFRLSLDAARASNQVQLTPIGLEAIVDV